MLEILRKGKRSVFGFIIIGFCAALMLPFGMDMINTSSSSGVPIVVDGEEVSQRQFYYRQQQIQEIFRSQFKENFAQIRKMLNLPQRTVDDLVNSLLMKKFLNKLNFGAGINQIENKIASHPYFQGQITQASFENFLRSQGLNSAALEQSTKKQIITEQLQKLLSHASTPSSSEVKNKTAKDSTLKRFKYIEIKSDNFKNKVKTDDKKVLETFFNENSTNYLTNRTIEFSAVPFESRQYLSSVEIDEQELKQIYESDYTRYFVPAQLKIKQLEIKKDRFTTSSEKPNDLELSQSEATAKEYIENIEKKLEQGEDFLTIAAKESDQSISTGWTNRKSVQKEIISAISNLEKGQISQVIETPISFKLVLFEDEKERAKKPFELVKSIIENRYRTENAPEYANAEAENLMSNENFIEEAKKLGKNVIKTAGAISAGQTVKGISAIALSKILELSQEDVDIISDNNASYLVKVEKVNEPDVPELNTVIEKVKKDYTTKQSIKLASAKAKELGKLAISLEDIAKQENLEIKKTEFLDKNQPAALPLNNQGDKFKAFALNDKQNITINTAQSNYLVALDQTKKSDNPNSGQNQISKSIQQANANRLFESLLKYLKSKATIEIDKAALES